MMAILFVINHFMKMFSILIVEEQVQNRLS